MPFRGVVPMSELFPPSPLTVLVVDDQRAIRHLVKRVLGDAGYSVAEAENGSHAMDILRLVGRMDLVLVDVVMPRLDGAGFVRTLLERYPQQRIIYMSGQFVEVLARYNLADFRLPFLAKPFTSDELLVKVEEALRPVPTPTDQRRSP
jgi:two-component system, cell cycle sensor histidine kinase and response regulator CckA